MYNISQTSFYFRSWILFRAVVMIYAARRVGEIRNRGSGFPLHPSAYTANSPEQHPGPKIKEV